MKLPTILVSVILFIAPMNPAESGPSALGPDTFINRSHKPGLAHYILSRSTGRLFPQPQPNPERTPGFQPDAPATRTPNPGRNPAVPPGLNRNILERLEPFDALILHYSQLHNVDPNLARAVIYIESAGDARAVSHRGAQGLMQLMPGTAADMGVDNAFDPAQNIFGGTRYLGRQIRNFGNIDLALWAYNAGPESVKRQHLPRETRNYIPSVMRVKRLLDSGGF